MKKITLTVAALCLILSGLSGCGANNQAGVGIDGQRSGAMGVDQHGTGMLNERYNEQVHTLEEAGLGNELPQNFGTDLNQGQGEGFLGTERNRQGQFGVAQDNGGMYRAGDRNLLSDHDPIAGPNQVQENQVTVQRTIKQIEKLDGVKEARVSGSVIEIRVAEGTNEETEANIEREAQLLSGRQTVRIVNRY
ncbi:hypothetical protein [Halalkalibacter akibai]|uniref:BON domain-containing protein n=1 Tax=Halalkalibacter akibai (strain ATCC 43226 / DSM 21942 / CIP 109018 / JCM 9157 / 1139) TaxID=1236973 RepID=W4QZ90_HALA3|nr:hypothetical protein [Halalkalibacter akibai]GAE36978.1 hypothetical protein JCM9157_4217 [Halalkalibacter akibai JCM 9157]